MTTTQKILIIGPSWVGDMVMAQCLFKIIKRRDVHTIIHVLAPAWTFSLLSRMPEVSHAIEMPIAHGELKLAKRYQLGKALRAAHYDQAIVCPNSFKSALIPWFARIPTRTGWLGEYRYGLLNDIRHLDKTRYPLMIEQYMALGLPANAPLPKPYPYPAFEVDKTRVDATVRKHKLQTNRPIIAMAPGAEFGPAKRWPEEYFAEVANQKIADGFDIWILGSQKDRPVADRIMQLTENRCQNLAGLTQLAETIDLLSLITGLITNDSGLMHIAAALQKPLVALYGPTSPAFTPPLDEHANVIQLKFDCQPCFQRICPLKHHRCMRDLTSDRVLSAIASWSH